MRRLISYSMILFGISLGMTSCYLANTMQTEVLRPAKLYFPSEAYRVGVAARMDLESNNPNEPGNSKSNEEFKRDSAILKSAVIGALDGLAESPRFQAFTVKPKRVLSGESALLTRELPWHLIEELSAQDTLDIVIVLASATFTDTIKYFDGELSYLLTPSTYWRIYNVRDRSVKRHIMKDTFVFPAGYGRGNYPPMKKLIVYFNEALGSLGYSFSRWMAPYWELEDRIWFPDGNAKLRKASSLAESGYWEDASEIWKEITLSKNRKMAAIACFNMAVAAEMMDKLDLSFEWLKQARKLGEEYYSSHYMQVIEQRKKTSAILEKQMKQ